MIEIKVDDSKLKEVMDLHYGEYIKTRDMLLKLKEDHEKLKAQFIELQAKVVQLQGEEIEETRSFFKRLADKISGKDKKSRLKETTVVLDK